MKYNLVLAVFLVGMLLAFAPVGARASSLPAGKQVSVVDSTPGRTFVANVTSINGTVAYNLVGSGGNDTFRVIAGNGSFSFSATGLHANSFNVTSGGGNSTFSFSSGDSSNFTIREGNVNGSLSTQSFAITGGRACTLNETSGGPVSNALWSVNLGVNSTVNLGSTFVGNSTVINILT